MASREGTYFVSDVHLGLDVKDPAEREARFVRFLSSIPRDTTESLWLLGDIWDFWYEYRDVVPKGYVRVFAQILDLIEGGVKVYFMPGNHDIWCYGYFRELGMEVVEQPCFVEIGGKTFCLGHGDGLGPGMKWYKLMRWGFHNRFLQRLFTQLHPWLAFRLGTGWSKKSRLAKNIGYVFRGESEPLWQYAAEVSSKRHVDYFIFGHYHVAGDYSLPTGARMLMLNSWMDAETSDYLYFSGMTVSRGYSKNIEK